MRLISSLCFPLCNKFLCTYTFCSGYCSRVNLTLSLMFNLWGTICLPFSPRLDFRSWLELFSSLILVWCWVLRRAVRNWPFNWACAWYYVAGLIVADAPSLDYLFSSTSSILGIDLNSFKCSVFLFYLIPPSLAIYEGFLKVLTMAFA